MSIAQSRLTAQGQISIPAEVRKKLGVGPGAVLEWVERGDEVVVRRAGNHSSSELHEALFAAETKTPLKSAIAGTSTKEGIRAYMQKKHARR